MVYLGSNAKIEKKDYLSFHMHVVTTDSSETRTPKTSSLALNFNGFYLESNFLKEEEPFFYAVLHFRCSTQYTADKSDAWQTLQTTHLFDILRKMIGSSVRKNWFLLGILVVIFLANWKPSIGKKGGM